VEKDLGKGEGSDTLEGKNRRERGERESERERERERKGRFISLLVKGRGADHELALSRYALVTTNPEEDAFSAFGYLQGD